MNEAEVKFSHIAGAHGITPALGTRPIVCIQGLGFVGAAMALAVAEARAQDGLPVYDVIGVDLTNEQGLKTVEALNAGRFPFETVDENLSLSAARAHETGNLVATTDSAVYGSADIIIVDVNFDLGGTIDNPDADFAVFREAITQIGNAMRADALVIVESTVPPGTCEKVVATVLETCLRSRDLPGNAFQLAHSYERVMPGPDYLASIINYWRVYAGHTDEAADACEAFLSKVVNTADYPLTRLSSTTASETSKVLENSFRATNIAFIEEWGRFAEAVGIDLYEVIDAIRLRPTHANIRQPGFGVGGYCLTKDPLFAQVSASLLFGRNDLDFPFSHRAVEVNGKMPLVSLDRLRRMVEGTLSGKTILLMGVSYREGIDDTRHSPSETFARAALNEGAILRYHDPLVRHWAELQEDISPVLPETDDLDAVVFAVNHDEYKSLDAAAWLKGSNATVLDANCVLGKHQRDALNDAGIMVESIGRGTAHG